MPLVVILESKQISSAFTQDNATKIGDQVTQKAVEH
jgi:hypothetical protein